MKSWYSHSRNLKLTDGSTVKEYSLTFQTTDKEIKSEIEAKFKEIMDRDLEPNCPEYYDPAAWE